MKNKFDYFTQYVTFDSSSVSQRILASMCTYSQMDAFNAMTDSFEFVLLQNKQNFVYLDICHFIHTKKNGFYYKFFFANSFACVPRAFSIFSKPFDSSKSPSSFFTF